ncbi:MAG: hypothetical protein QCI82_10655, partial [Candidatus Thermoplasmatota archaeon]|nr:hypothetical protein [Candidatus Thermoplasmatota archaeon]
EFWNNITIIRNIEEFPPIDPDNDIPWVLISLVSIALVIIVLLAVLLLMFLRKKKKPEYDDLPEDRSMEDIFGGSPLLDDSFPERNDTVFDDPERSIPPIEYEQEDPFEAFDLPGDVIGRQDDRIVGVIEVEPAE